MKNKIVGFNASLKISNVSDDLISCGSKCHSLLPKYLKEFIPYVVVFTLGSWSLWLSLNSFLKLGRGNLNSKNWKIQGGECSSFGLTWYNIDQIFLQLMVLCSVIPSLMNAADTGWNQVVDRVKKSLFVNLWLRLCVRNSNSVQMSFSCASLSFSSCLFLYR